MVKIYFVVKYSVNVAHTNARRSKPTYPPKWTLVTVIKSFGWKKSWGDEIVNMSDDFSLMLLFPTSVRFPYVKGRLHCKDHPIFLSAFLNEQFVTMLSLTQRSKVKSNITNLPSLTLSAFII